MIDFGSDDVRVLQAILIKLSKKENYAVVQRFWADQTIESISKDLRMSWDDTNQLLEEAIKKLKEYFIDERQREARLKSEHAA